MNVIDNLKKALAPGSHEFVMLEAISAIYDKLDDVKRAIEQQGKQKKEPKTFAEQAKEASDKIVAMKTRTIPQTSIPDPPECKSEFGV